MAGCYGDSPEDRYIEAQINRYLKQCNGCIEDVEKGSEVDSGEAKDDYNEHFSDNGD